MDSMRIMESYLLNKMGARKGEMMKGLKKESFKMR